MGERIFLNSEVARVIGVTPRQVLAWTEKGVVQPHRETRGAGTKRGYSFVNLLEFALAKTLFAMGMTLQTVKGMLSTLRQSGGGLPFLQSWAANFADYYREWWRIHAYLLGKYKEELDYRSSVGWSAEDLPFPDQPPPHKEHIGFLFYFFKEKGDYFTIIPGDFDYAFHQVVVYLKDSTSAIIIDLGQLKRDIEGRL
jgi:DNA-binding transcriptional MerR regulator